MSSMASLAAGPAGSSSSNIHLASCSTPACQSFLQRMRATLLQHNISFVDKYEPGGLYQDRFEHAFGQSSCTILHICPEVLSKVKRVLTVLKREPNKAWFVQLQTQSSDGDLGFFLDFNIVDLCTEDSQSRFLEELVIKFGNSDAGGRSAGCQTQNVPELLAAQHPDPATIPTSAGDAFQSLSMVLRAGASSVPYVNKLFLKLDFLQCTGIDAEALSQEDIATQDQAYLSQVVLPDLLAKRDLVSLAQLACSHHIPLRLQALHLIGGLLLEQYPSACLSETLERVEKILSTAVEQQFQHQVDLRQDTDFVGQHLDCDEFLVIIYLMLVAMYILKVDTSRRSSFLQGILQRPLFQMQKSPSFKSLLKWRSSQRVATVPGWYKAVKACLMAWSDTSACEQVKSRRSSTVHSSHETTYPQLSWHKVAGWSLELKLLLLVDSLVKSFKDSKPVFLSFMENFQPKVEVRETYRTLQRIITLHLIFGLSSFLQHQSEKLSSYDSFPQMCKHSVDFLDKVVSALDKRSRVICNFHLTSLLFNTNKIIRQRTGFLLRRQFFYHEHLWELLLLETSLIMWPLLGFSDAKPDRLASSQQSWLVVKSTFNGHSVQTHSHRPTGTHHLRYNRTEDQNILHQDQYFRELGFLKELKHANVLQLVAFHDTYCPQFYITEDYRTTALQPMLVNRSRNGRHFALKRLLTFLVGALDGIQYCHDKSIVHRDLTAANLFITADEKIKLAGFKHALKLSGKQCIRDFDLSFIATRWSAPESLQQCNFSVASDMWMVGHLMYEVLTHGRLPYADVRWSDGELMPSVVHGYKTLCSESCIPEPIQHVIQALSSVRETQCRMSAQDVASRLQEILGSAECSESLCRYFPDLSSDQQAATKHAKGPVLSLIDDYPGITLFPEANNEEEKMSGYLNFGPKKGPVHFVEPCPHSFTMEEWTTLSQEDLPAITKLIGRPTKNPSGQTVLPFVVAAASLCSLKDAVLSRWLGKDLEPYLLCLQQLASNISYLHSRRIILCDFAADTIYVEKNSEDNKLTKVWVTSLPLVKVLPRGSELDQNVDLPCPQNGDQRRRAAPEVLQHGQYSPASDVYCFGMLAWWVFNAFDHSIAGDVETPDSLSPLDSVPMKEVYENVVESFGCVLLPKPDCCPQHIYDLMKECWQAKLNRPRIDKLRRSLVLDRSEIMRSDLSEDGYEPIMSVANPSEDADSCSDCTSIISSSFTIGNPSELTDTYLEAEDCYVSMDFDEEIYTDIGTDYILHTSTSTMEDGKSSDTFTVQAHSSHHGGDEPACSYKKNAEVQSSGLLAAQPERRSACSQVSGDQSDNVYTNTPPPLPLRIRRHEGPQNVVKSEELPKPPLLVSDSQSLSSLTETMSNLQNPSKGKMQTLSLRPPVQPRHLPHEKKALGEAEPGEGHSRPLPPLPPASCVQSQTVFDAGELPSLLAAAGSDPGFSVSASRAEKAVVDVQAVPQQHPLPPSQPQCTGALSMYGDDTCMRKPSQVPAEPATPKGSSVPVSDAVACGPSSSQGERMNETAAEGKEGSDVLQGAGCQTKGSEPSSALPGSSTQSSSKCTTGFDGDADSSDDDLYKVVFV